VQDERVGALRQIAAEHAGLRLGKIALWGVLRDAFAA
jgi:hypothetical protein